jgi:hypothetical protein
MATLVFGALGTLVGGPIGGAVGALIGREADRALIGTGTRQGPRLKELAVSTSSYGQPIPRQFGAVRAAGTIVWATDMKETRDRVSGGKGQPATNSYSYSASLAVALSSRPIEDLGRIWADGNLLRGAAGDLKTGGTLRLYRGHADQPRDPLLAAALGEQCPAHRGLAYVVFEDLQLGDFGNRIPALSFEVFAAGGGAGLIPALGAGALAMDAQPVPGAAVIEGFSHEGGSLAQALDMLSQSLPIVADAGASGLAIGPPGQTVFPLPEPIASADGEYGRLTGKRRGRREQAVTSALRYYDSGRDHLPGFQRGNGRARVEGERAVELPATLSASGARALADALRQRAAEAAESLQLRIAALDPAIAPGALVAVAGAGHWRVEAWEWRSDGIDLTLRRSSPAAAAPPPADSGAAWRPADRLPARTSFAAFELPWDGSGSADVARVNAALGAGAGRWAGAAIFVERAGTFEPLANAGPSRAITGRLAASMPASPALLFEPRAQILMQCDDPEAELASIDGAAMAAGANRLLVGEELIQFMRATPLGAGRWQLGGLLRGRGATEAEASAGHTPGAQVVLLDERLLQLDAARFDSAAERLAAIGAADRDPVFASVATPGRSRRPLTPVHPRAAALPGGGLALAWTRRARGAWAWPDAVDVPLVEEFERYEIGAGPVSAPVQSWLVEAPALALSAADLAALGAGTVLWVRQLGSHGRSPALFLYRLV